MTVLTPTAGPLDRRIDRPAGGVDLLAIARHFARPSPAWPGSPDQRERCWRLIAADDRFGAYVIGWPVGAAIQLHDHGSSAGAFVVVSGVLTETSVASGAGAGGLTSVRIPAHGSVAFEPGHVHGIVNDGSQPAVSVHVYSPALRAMTFFDSSDGRDLVALRTESYGDDAVIR